VWFATAIANRPLGDVFRAFDINQFPRVLVPMLVVFVLWLAYRWFPEIARKSRYLIFFSISITSLLGFTKTLTGAYVASSQSFTFGLAFYSAAIAYYLGVSNRKPTLSWAFAANPLFLTTGPVAVQIYSIKHWGADRRRQYFSPWLILGLFYFWAISVPLGQFSTLLQKTDVVSSLTYAIILELFVYFNFAGLSFIAYALAGYFGYKIPLNFKQPFSARNLLEYWKGWHLSLSTVLKELFYTPMRRRFGSFAAIIVVYMSSAMWHGVSLNFLIWGLFHGIAYFGSLSLLKSKRQTRTLNLFLLFVGIVLGRLLFGESNSSRLLEKLTFQFKDFEVINSLLAVPIESKVALIIALLIVAVEFLGAKAANISQRNYKFFRIPKVQILLILATVLLISSGLGQVFAVYGQR
jgi:hypothetical protein